MLPREDSQVAFVLVAVDGTPLFHAANVSSEAIVAFLTYFITHLKCEVVLWSSATKLSQPFPY